MEELKKWVEKLEKVCNEKEQIRILQTLGKKLINEYRIEIGNVIIEPLLVEAYYYHKGKFEDTSIHAAKESKANTYKLARCRQKNNFGKLYVHYGTKDGIDIVLSRREDYYLSFLIKAARIGNIAVKQCGVSENICGRCEERNTCKGCRCKYYKNEVLKPLLGRERKNSEVVLLPRKGIKNDFALKPLAILSVETFADKSVVDKVVQSLAEGYKKQWVLAKYALGKANCDIDRARKIIFEEKLYQSRVEDQYFDRASKYIKEQER